MLTIEEAMAGIQAGKLQMEGIPLLEFDSYIMPVKNIPFIIFKISMMLIRKMRKV